MKARKFSALVWCAVLSIGCAATTPPPGDPSRKVDASGSRPGTADEAREFASRVNAELKDLWVKQQTAEWIKSTYITDDTERNAAWANEAVLGFLSRAVKESMRFSGLKVDDETARTLYLLRNATPVPAPDNPEKRAELASIAAKLEGMYGKGKYCGEGYVPGTDEAEDKRRCRDLQQLSAVMDSGKDYDAMLEAWAGWRTVSPPMRPLYERLVALTNEGARELGAADVGELWRSAYDMPPEAFEREADRLWGQVKPLYDDLHCFVRARLAKRYGADKVKPGGPIPAHLLGNMWAQEWGNIYPLVEPFKGQQAPDLTRALLKQGYDEVKLVKLGERFFESIGLGALPDTFWKRSMFKKPEDREVVCHASAWDVQYNNDLRIKMCIKIDAEDLGVVHHELGHNYYFKYYHTLPALFQQGANDGFHEAIGDALTLSITPEYLKKLSLITALPKDEKGLINLMMRTALDKIAFLPFARMMDQWRWDVFSGKVKPEQYNAHWWTLRTKYQGIASAVARGEADFDPGAKYHIPASVPYMRYFLARVLQFQFHRALCQTAGHQGPLHACSIYGNKPAGEKLEAMLTLGASKPWPEALYVLTGQREMDASALIEYFQPLQAWLKEQNRGQTCGW